jgi:hypothetical protein
MSAPHFHPEDRHAVVLRGTWYTGTDDSWDPGTTEVYPGEGRFGPPHKLK